MEIEAIRNRDTRSTSYRDLEVWQLAVNLVKDVYALTEEFIKSETYGLTLQLKRAAASIPSNIAEGQARNSAKEFRQFLSVALGSIAELETQLIIAKELGFAKENSIAPLFDKTDSLTRMTKSLIRSLNLSKKGPHF